MKELKRFLAAGACLAAVLSGCASPLPADVEGLLDAPRLSDQQYEIHQALREQLGQEVKLKYPQSGRYRSAFTFHDMDGDGAEEAVVLHAYQGGGNAQITIMDLTADGQWRVERTYPGLSPDVDFLRFETLMEGGSEEIVIGWKPEGGQKIVAAYRYEDRDFSMLGSEDYTQLAIGDYNGDGKSELLLVSAEDGGSASLLYLGERDGLLDTLDSISLGREVVSFQAPLSGYIAPGVYGLALDGVTSRGNLCTILAYVEDGQLVLPLNEGDGALFHGTTRPGGEAAVYCQDVTGDGVIDIPTQWTPPGYDRLDVDSRLAFTSYVNLVNGGFTTVLRAYVDPAAGFRLILPDQWLAGGEQVTASRRAGSGEITFFLYTNGDIGDRSRELLRLQVVDLQSPPRQFDPDQYFLLARRGSFEYHASLPGSRGEEGYALTQEEAAGLFQLL